MISALIAAALLLPPTDTLPASRVSARLSVSPPSSSAGAEELRRSLDLPSAVRQFGGVQIRDYGGVGGLKTINVRSLGSAHTAIFMDGVPIDNAQNMQVDLGRFYTDDLESAELYSGQKSTLVQTAREYGSASSLHLRSSLPQGRKFRFRLRGGAFGMVSPSGSIETRRGAFAARLRLGGEMAHGQYPFHVTDFRSTPEGYKGYDTALVRQNCDIRSFRASTHFWYLPRGGRWEASARWYDSGRGIPGPVYKQSGKYPLSDDRQYDRSLSLQLGGEQALGHGLSLLVRSRYSYDALDYIDVSELDPSVTAAWNYRLRSAYSAASLGWRAASWLHLNAALDFQADWLRCQFNAERQQLLVALSSAFILDPWRIQASVQWQGSSDGYSFLSPALILDWHPREDWEFGGLVKRSCRLPSFNDLYYTNVGARELRPENVWQGSAWWLWDRAYGPLRIRLREELYANRVLDKLIAVPNGSLFRWSMYNIGRVNIFGDDWEASALYTSGSWSTGATARYSFQWAREEGSAYQIPYSPLHSASFRLFAVYGAFRAELNAFVTGERLTAGSNRREYHLDPWSTLDATIGWKKGIVSVSLEGHNLLNRQYQIVKGYPMPGVNVMGTVAIEF